MISFIVIGKNIQTTIDICLSSIFHFIDINRISSFEIIYVDSNSSDDSVNLARSYPIEIIEISGTVNAAIGRNAGAKKAKGEILFFLDGDMELLPEFFNSVFDVATKRLNYPFTNGLMKEKYYDIENNFLYSRDEKIGDKPHFEHVTGGLIIIEKKLWNEMGGMDERLIRNEDLDFGLRMSKIGFPVLKDNHFWIIHHTISYLEKERFSNFFISKSLFSPGLLMRKHFLNYTYLKCFIRNVLYFFILLFAIIFLFISPAISAALLTIYLSIQVLRTIRVFNKEKYLFRSFLFKSLFNIYSLIGFLFVYPGVPVYNITLSKGTDENNLFLHKNDL
jgi:glycosyltransferase involved in cell wall biosynthesis